MGFAAQPARDLEPVADLDALDGLDRHQRLGEHRVDLAVPVDVRAEADRHAEAEHLDDAAEGVALLRRRLDRGDHAGGAVGVEATDLGGVDGGEVGRRRPGRVGGDTGIAHLDHVRDDLDAQVREQLLGECTGGDARRRLTRRGPLEHVACVGEPVLLHAGEVGVARTHLGQRLPWSRQVPATSPRATCRCGTTRSS